jgi:hypothetical protein
LAHTKTKTKQEVTVLGEKKVITIEESTGGSNIRYKDTDTGVEMTRDEFVQKIEAGEYPGYNVQNRKGKKIPRSNPDDDPDNNLG